MTAFTSNIEVTASDIYTISGTNPDITAVQQTIGQAQFTIETISGVPFKVDEREFELSVADAAWLKKAVVFQVIWLMGQVATLERQAVSSVSQDGLSLQAPDGLTFVLAPLAKRALNNCSWARTGTLKVAAPSELQPRGDFLVDDNHAWTPLAGA